VRGITLRASCTNQSDKESARQATTRDGRKQNTDPHEQRIDQDRPNPLERLPGGAWPVTKYVYLVDEPDKHTGENTHAERNESLAPGLEYREARTTATENPHTNANKTAISSLSRCIWSRGYPLPISRIISMFPHQ
jgi:hypothetical protein